MLNVPDTGHPGGSAGSVPAGPPVQLSGPADAGEAGASGEPDLIPGLTAAGAAPEEAPGTASGSFPRRAWLAFRRWRHARPFGGGLLVTIGGAEILFTEKVPLKLILHIGVQGLAGYLLPTVMLLCGLFLLFNPAQRSFYAILAVVLAIGTWLTSNLGGFFIGMLCGMIGGGMAFAWKPPQPEEQPLSEPA